MPRSLGPLIDERAAVRVETWIREAVQQGATLRTGGTRDKSLIHPAVLTDVDQHMKISCEEVFGPVITLSRYRHLDQAFDMVNDSPYGLQAGIFTRNVDSIFRAYQALDVGHGAGQ